MKELQVFIVEDDIKNADIHQKLISKIEGFSVIGIAEHFQDAKDLLPAVKPDLVLLDIFLPDGSGMELLWLIRQKLRHTDVMMITAAKEVEYVEQAIRAGAVDYLIKPIMFSRLKETLLNYRSYRLKVNTLSSIDQTDVDTLMAKRRNLMKEKQMADADYPKGIDGLTLKKVAAVLHNGENTEGITAENLGRTIGVSRTTARRYLEFLAAEKYVKTELYYGTVGRPERRYKQVKADESPET
ncbi:response regulator [Bacillus swezeyi]|uniref:Two-component system response regulator n=1 Tax=Bacillus swezeyi TaxID=1925020 RepID=A0A1R1S0I7_9BACI|nr:response regulator [Bacillus swezeyi]MEC1261527.1 response regulator [Bacillus swezeyi]MED1739205.1 response regulator [Bacillus swezeyi]MED2926610.1 response regulator [Bacillus swezeyi]MED2944081.1 response regulator [Bacillus swezeyi]MED2965828.1 response regulator [Bacillus swezeyi]